MIIGKRANGKSYAVKEYVLQDYVENSNRFIYVRRYASDVTVSLAEQYFGDTPIEKITHGKQNALYVKAGKIYIYFQDDDGSRSNVEHVGYVRSVATAQRYASGAYPDVRNIIYEEFISLDGKYLSNEIMLFKHLISTVARRKELTVFLIANCISRLSPYFREFGITNIEKQIAGTIDIYKLDDTSIACEYCSNNTSNSKMIFGQDKKMTNEGKWLTNEYPKLPLSFRGFSQSQVAYSFVVQWHSTNFLVRYVISNTNSDWCLFVSTKTTKIQKNTRLITNEHSADPLTTKGFLPISPQERVLFGAINSGHIFYSDDLTGTEFNEVLHKLGYAR